MANPNTNNQNSQEILGFAQFMAKNGQNFSNQQIDQTNKILADMVNNSNAAEQAMQNFRDTLDTMGVSLGNILKGGNKITPFMDEFGAINATELSEELRSMSDKDLTKALTDFQSKMADSREIIQDFGNDVMTFQNKINRTDFFEKIKSGEINLKEETEELKKSLGNLKNTLSPDTYNRYKEILDKIANSTNKADEITDELVGDVTRLTEKLKNASINNAQEIKNFEEKAGKELTTAYNAQNAADDTAKIGQKYKEGYADQENIQNILNTLNAVQQLTFAWQTFQNLGSIWSNTDLTDGEKLLQTIMNLSVALPSLIIGFSQLHNTLSNVTSFFQNAGLENRQKPLIDAAKASLEEAKAIEANKNKQKEAISAYQQKLRAQKENLEASQQEAQQEITVTELVIRHTQAEIDRLSVLQEKNTIALETAKANLTVANSLLEEAKAEKTLHEIRLNTLKQEYAMKEASGKLGAKERHKYESAIATSDKLIQNDDNEINIAQEMMNSAKSEVNQLTKEQEGITNRLSDARENLTKSTNKLSEAQEKLKTSGEQLQQIEQKMNSVVMSSIGVLGDLGRAHKTVVEATEGYKEILKKAGQETATFKDLVKGVPIVFSSFAKGLGMTGTALLGWIGIAAAVVAGIGAIIWTIDKETKEQEERAKILEEINDKTKTTANTLTETLPTYQKLRDEFKATGEASTDFIKSLEEQAKALGINDAEVDIAKGHYEELIKKIDEASSAALNAANILSVNNLKEANIGDAFSEEQKKELGLTTHIETTVLEGRGTDTGTSIMSSQEVYDQSAWEMITLVQEKVKANEKELIELNKQYDQALSDQNESEALSLSRQIQNLQLKTQDYRNILDQYSDLANSVQEIGERALIDRANASEEGNQDFLNILREGTFEEVKESVKETLEANVALKESIGELSNEQIEALAASMMKLYENSNLAAEAIEKQKNLTNNYRTAEEQENIQKDLGLSNEEYLGYKTSLVDNNEHIKFLQDEAINEENSAKAIKEHREQLIKETSELVKNKDALEERLNKVSLSPKAYQKEQQKLEDLNKQIEDNRKILKQNIKTQEDYQKQLDDLENRIIETALGAKELGEVWEDNASILRDTTADWAEQREAINNIAPGLAHLLNMDLSEIEMLPDSFFTSTQNLNDMEAALNGNTEALQRLRGEAALGILVAMGISPDSDIYEEAKALVDWANEALPNIETGATIDSGEYYAELNAMVQSMIAAGMDIEAIAATLSKIGLTFEPDGTTSTMRVPKPRVHYTAMHDPDIQKNRGSSTVEAIVENTWEDIPVNNYKFTRTSGGSGFTGGYSPKSSGGGGGGSCFIAGTLVSTIDNFKNIEDIKVGDIVLSYNEQTQQNEYSQVLQTMIHVTIEPIYTLYIRNEQLRVTGIHRFLIKRNNVIDWIKAEDLRLGDWVLFANGTWHLILDIDVNIEAQVVYNFEVSHNHNYYVGKHQILAHNKGGKGGGGGSGGSGKVYEPKENKDPLKEKKDLYEKVNAHVDHLNETLAGIEKQEERLTGAKHQANLQKQIDLIEQTVHWEEERLKIQRQEAADLRTDLANKYGIKFDSQGFITNYATIFDKLQKSVNDLGNKYSTLGSEEAEKELDKQYEAAKELFDNFKDDLKRYDELVSKDIENTINSLDELQIKLDDLRISMFKIGQDARKDLKDLNKMFAEMDGFFTGLKKKDPLRDLAQHTSELERNFLPAKENMEAFYDSLIERAKTAKALTSDADEIDAYNQLIKTYEIKKADLANGNSANNGLLQTWLDDLQALVEWTENPENSPFKNSKEQLYELIEDTMKELSDEILELEDLVDTVVDDIISKFDDWADRIEEIQDKYDKQKEWLEVMRDSYTLLFGEDSYEGQIKFVHQQAEIIRQQQDNAKQNLEFWNNQMAEALKSGNEEVIKQVQKNIDDWTLEIAKLSEEAAEAFLEEYQLQVKKANQEFLESLTGGRKIDYFEFDWEWDQDKASKYKDDIEKAYEYDKLRTKYIDVLNNAQGASLQTQNKIRAQMQEELDALQNQVYLSQYDVDLANAKLEILQKQIALEDAQRNKNKMQLRRDTQGNYRYVYAANKDDIASAQQDLMNANYDAYELSKNNYMQVFNDYIQEYKKLAEQKSIIENDMNLDSETRQAELSRIYAKEEELRLRFTEEFADAKQGMFDALMMLMRDSSTTESEQAKLLYDAMIEDNQEALDQMGVGIFNYTNYAGENLDTVHEAWLESINKVNTAYEELWENTINGDNAVIPQLKGGMEGVNTIISQSAVAMGELASATQQLFDALGAEEGPLHDAMVQLSNYEQQIKNLQDTTNKYVALWKDTSDKLVKVKAENATLSANMEGLKTGRLAFDEGGNLYDVEERRRKEEEERQRQAAAAGSNGGLSRSRVEQVYNLINSGAVGNAPARWGNLAGRGYSQREINAGQELINRSYPTWDNGWGWDYGDALNWVMAHYDTGGYTGTWNQGIGSKNGKMAVLHQKELVLNADDTRNILAAVDMMRTIISSNQGLFSGLVKQASTNNISTEYNPVTEQRVEIQATFPNATDADDIRQAILGLSDRAYQYAHRRI